MIKEITKKYNTVSQLIAHEGNDNIAICDDGKNFYVHKRNQIYDHINSDIKLCIICKTIQ